MNSFFIFKMFAKNKWIISNIKVSMSKVVPPYRAVNLDFARMNLREVRHTLSFLWMFRVSFFFINLHFGLHAVFLFDIDFSIGTLLDWRGDVMLSVEHEVEFISFGSPSDDLCWRVMDLPLGSGLNHRVSTFLTDIF